MRVKFMSKKTVLSLLKSLAVQIAATVLAIFFLAFLMLRMEWGTEQLETGVLVTYGVICFAGGFLSGLGEGGKKFLRGLFSGGIYFVILIFLSLIGGRQLAADTARVLTVLESVPEQAWQEECARLSSEMETGAL